RRELLGAGRSGLVERALSAHVRGQAVMSDPILEPVRFIDERTAAAPLLKKALRYVFPDHWSFLLGEVALYCFILLVATGIYLALFFEPSTAHTVYHGPYKELDG